MYKLRQEVTVQGLGALKVVDAWINDAATEYVYKLDNGKCYLESQVKPIAPRRACVWRTARPYKSMSVRSGL